VPPTTTGSRPCARASSIASCASRWYAATDASCSSGQTPTSRVGRSDWLVRTGTSRYTCIASAETSSAGTRSAIASATALFPDAVGPKIARTRGGYRPRMGERTVGRSLPLLALIAANSVSLAGNVLATVAVPWFVLETTGSPAKAGIAAFFTTLPLALGAVLGGTLADRLGRRTASVATDLVSAAAIAGVPLLHAAGRLEFWHLAALVFLTSLFDAPGQAAREALVPGLAARSGRSLERATSLWVSTEHIAYVVGAPLAGILIATLGAANVLWVDAASFVLAAVLVATAVAAEPVEVAERRPYLQDLREGLRTLLGDPVLRTFLVVASVGNMLAAPIALVCLPVYANQVLDSAPALGLTVAAYGVGGIAGALLLEPAVRLLGRMRAYFVSWVLWAGLYFAIAALPPLPIMIAVLLATGLSVAAPIEALVRQERTPAELRARVFATQMAALTVAAPVGVIVAGFLVDAIGLRPAMLALASANALLAFVFVRPAARGIRVAAEQAA
jgi:predicted MFS family arabinose efflux permease